MRIEDLTKEEYERIHENSLKTAERYAWNGLVIYGMLSYLDSLLGWAEHPENNYFNPKYRRRMKRHNRAKYNEDMWVYAWTVIISIIWFSYLYYLSTSSP